MRNRLLIVSALVLTLVIASVIIVSASPPVQARGPAFKHLAGPASEVYSGMMALPNPAQLGVRSHSAMLPVHLQQQEGAFQWQALVPVDTADGVSFVLLSPQAENWRIDVKTPGERSRWSPLEKTPGVNVEKRVESFGYDGLAYPSIVYHIASRAPQGQWLVQITSSQAGDGYLIVGAESSYRLYAHLADYNLAVGERVGLVAYIYDANAASSGEPTPLSGVAHQMALRVMLPAGDEVMVEMFDDGKHRDGAAGDGVFGGDFVARSAGLYKAQIVARGITPHGQAFLRTSQHIFPVISKRAMLGENVTVARADDVRLTIGLPVRGLDEGALVRVYAEVWGVDDAGKAAPAAWIGGLSQVQQGRLSILFDSRWLSYAHIQPPLELRHVRLQDNATSIPLAMRSQLSLSLKSLPKAAVQPISQITPEMLVGPRPAQADVAPLTATASGGKLMLVHGYCSEGVWPTSDFTDVAVFQDYNQNRSHDEFARLIRDFGAQFPSFGVVAHSQGGAASLHLYTYYWSGLDYSSGDRLIQSVGTPYQGTALAGNLALLGEIFGAGCGPNWDLTYDGSALWLAGIPSWARSRVHYWTTSDEDVWWRWDYCSAATDIVLDDPEDGVVERWAGQLSGAYNHGHKEGWCHTNDMRDPAQFLDHDRNHEMNTYANR